MNRNIDMKDNEKIRDMIENSRQVVREAWYENKNDLSEKEKKILFREMKKFNEYGDILFRDEEEDLNVLAQKLKKLTEFAQTFLTNNADEDFDKVTINRNIKEVNKYIEKFKKIANELKEKEERLGALYEDIGVIFNRYFDIEDSEEVSFEDEEEKEKGWQKAR